MTDHMFESNGLLDFPPTASPLSPVVAAGVTAATTTNTTSTPASTILSEANPSRFSGFDDDGGIFDDLPPPLEEEPEDWEAEMMAMQELEAEEEAARSRALLVEMDTNTMLDSANLQGKGKGKGRAIHEEVEARSSGQDSTQFGESDMFDGMEVDHQTSPFASPSRASRIVKLGSGENEGTSRSHSIRREAIERERRGSTFAFSPSPERQTETQTNSEARADMILGRPESRYQGPKCLLPLLRAETANGRVMYIKRRFKPTPPPLSHLPPDTTANSNILGKPLTELLKEVEVLKNLQVAKRLQAEYNADLLRNTSTSTSTPLTDSHASAGPSRQMWVDKYRPKRFADLLGEDRTHRDVLSWLKEWDQCVFKRVAPGKKRKLASSSFFGSAANGTGSGTFGSGTQADYSDPLGRPQNRILLLSGPPGYGKTTLAQILARQAGYKTLEINASDDRNAGTVTARIKNAIEAGSGLTAGLDGKGEKRPVCVVLDECDGASGGGDGSFIKSLIKLIQDVPANKRRNIPAKPLRRPIICICNDLYAPALRPLRPFAKVIRFRKPASAILVKRLQEVCRLEGLRADLRVLGGLVEVTGGDVRSCLNTQQFIKSRESTVTDESIRSASVGSKSSSTSLQSAWSGLFVPLGAKVRRKQAGLSTSFISSDHASSASTLAGSSDAIRSTRGPGTGAAAVESDRFIPRLSHLISSSGDMDRLMQGAFEHYPHTRPTDASWRNLCKILDKSVHFYDAINKRVGESQEWELMGYEQYGIMGWTGLSGQGNAGREVEWPKADYEAYLARTTNLEITTTFTHSLPPMIRSLFPGPNAMITELIPFLMRIISPPLKPVNANIVKPAEKAVLARLVELMIELGMGFWVEKGDKGAMMRLEPPIDAFVHYEGKRADDMSAGRFAVRQLVAQAIDAEKARRRGAAAKDETNSAGSLAGMYDSRKADAAAKPAVKETVATDFFGRKIVKKAKIPLLPIGPNGQSEKSDAGQRDGEGAGEEEGEVPEVIVKFRAVYKYHEGSSAAVRRGVKMSALM